MPVFVASFKEGIAVRRNKIDSFVDAMAVSSSASSTKKLGSGERQQISIAAMINQDTWYHIETSKDSDMEAYVVETNVNGEEISKTTVNMARRFEAIMGNDKQGVRKVFALILILSDAEMIETFDE